MQKYQNFLVKAGRQCWPGDHTGMRDTIARRVSDIMADQWITNIVKGGITTGGSSGSSFGAGGQFGGSPFDATFTDSAGLTTNGFYISESTGNQHMPIAYENGMAFYDKCQSINCEFKIKKKTRK